jgi:hypothetical protein
MRQSRRLKLVDAKVFVDESGFLDATVKLRFQENLYIGIWQCENQEDKKLEVVAVATLEAIRKAIPAPVDMYVRKVAQMKPEFLNDILIVAMVDIYIEGKRLSLTGCCICEQEDIIYGAARAALDSTNRVVEFLLAKYHKKND